jgi:hypothetical protein
MTKQKHESSSRLFSLAYEQVRRRRSNSTRSNLATSWKNRTEPALFLHIICFSRFLLSFRYPGSLFSTFLNVNANYSIFFNNFSIFLFFDQNSTESLDWSFYSNLFVTDMLSSAILFLLVRRDDSPHLAEPRFITIHCDSKNCAMSSVVQFTSDRVIMIIIQSGLFTPQ